WRASCCPASGNGIATTTAYQITCKTALAWPCHERYLRQNPKIWKGLERARLKRWREILTGLCLGKAQKPLLSLLILPHPRLSQIFNQLLIGTRALTNSAKSSRRAPRH